MRDAINPIRLWIFTGCAMIFVMVLVGGITRLTDSGLSIVEWKPIMGAIPPLNEAEWYEAFGKYKQIPQYKRMNKGMGIAEFKQIFLWEYLHRLLGRLIGVAFLLPFFYFIIRKKSKRPLLAKLWVAFVLGALQGFVGWFMVQSGLAQNVSVSHYRLALHLLLAVFLYSYLLTLGLGLSHEKQHGAQGQQSKHLFWLANGLILLIAMQFFYGALMAGLKAGLFYPTYPLMNGQLLPDGFSVMDTWHENLFCNVTTVQWVHRYLPIPIGLLLASILFVAYKMEAKNVLQMAWLALGSYLLQFALGIATVLHCIGHVPLFWGVLHQAGAMLFLSLVLWLRYLAATKLPHKNERHLCNK